MRRAWPKPWSATARASLRLRASRSRLGLRQRPSRSGRPGPWWPCAEHRRGRSRPWHGCGRVARPACAGSHHPAFRECARWRGAASAAEPQRLRPGDADDLPASSTPVSSVLTPRSTPIAEPGRACRSGIARSTSTVNDTNQRCAVRETVADRMRAVPSPAAGQLAGGLVRTDRAEAGQGDRRPGAADHPGAEPERVPALAPLLDLREPQPLALPLALLRLVKSRSARSRSRNAS